jgi:hypothetical protein
MTLTKPFVRLSVLLGVSLLAFVGSAAAPDPPNIVLVVVDNLLFDGFGAAGHASVRTPALTTARFTEQVRDHLVASGATREADTWVRREVAHAHQKHQSGFR